jgi:plasmid stability protein
MATILIRKVDEALKARLRIRAARHGRSMEQEAREILRAGLASKSVPDEDLGTAIRKRVEPIGGIDIELPPREAPREPPTFK